MKIEKRVTQNPKTLLWDREVKIKGEWVFWGSFGTYHDAWLAPVPLIRL